MVVSGRDVLAVIDYLMAMGRHREASSMPFKSQAQRRKFAELLVQGKISNQTFEEWNRETGSEKLPERVGSKKRSTRKKAVKKKAARKKVGAKKSKPSRKSKAR
jgi:hypothetical protein